MNIKFFRILLAGISPLLLFFLACGDETTQVVQEKLLIAESVSDLPDCDKDRVGEQAVVVGETSVRVCIDSEWIAMNGEGDRKSDFSCSAEPLKDSSGVKIICNGDSIGVVLNGTQGQKGMAGEGCRFESRTDTSVTITCGDSSMTFSFGSSKIKDSNNVEPPLDSEAIAVSLDSLTGYSQKGPFVKGSAVYLYELENGYTLKQTNGNFVSSITRDDGRFKFTARNLVSQYVMLLVNGNYRNEVTGTVSKNQIQLKAISNMLMHKTANVNILTHLEFERVYHLVTKEHYTVLQAKRKAQKEILALFHIELDGKTEAEDMNVFGKSDADAALLAVSILLQGNRTESEMMALLTEVSNDMAENGEWKGDRADSIKTAIADWAFGQNLSKFRKNVEGWGLNSDNVVGNFEKFINNFIAKVYKIDVCSEENSISQTVVNPKSIFYGRSYQCYKGTEENPLNEVTWIDVRPIGSNMNKTAKYGQMIDWRDRRMYYTVGLSFSSIRDNKYYSKTWMAENLDFDYRLNDKTYGTYCFRKECGSDSSKMFGRYYNWAAAMDSAGLYSSDGVGCGGRGKTCVVSTDRVRGVCPEGWYLPTKADWDSLISFVKYDQQSENIQALMSASGWFDGNDGTDVYGYSIIPAEAWDDWNFEKYWAANAYFWSSTEKDGSEALEMVVNRDGDVRINGGNKHYGNSVRCIKESFYW